MKKRWPIGTLVALLVTAAGCGQDTTVTGRVTYDGQPVTNGAITFYPQDGKGPTAGATITAGRYRIEGVVPGRKLVQVVGTLGREEGLFVPQTTDELRQQSERLGTAGADRPTGGPAALISPDAPGNSSVVEIRSGAQKLDFHLTPPPTDR